MFDLSFVCVYHIDIDNEIYISGKKHNSIYSKRFILKRPTSIVLLVSSSSFFFTLALHTNCINCKFIIGERLARATVEKRPNLWSGSFLWLWKRLVFPLSASLVACPCRGLCVQRDATKQRFCSLLWLLLFLLRLLTSRIFSRNRPPW